MEIRLLGIETVRKHPNSNSRQALFGGRRRRLNVDGRDDPSTIFMPALLGKSEMSASVEADGAAGTYQQGERRFAKKFGMPVCVLERDRNFVAEWVWI